MAQGPERWWDNCKLSDVPERNFKFRSAGTSNSATGCRDAVCKDFKGCKDSIDESHPAFGDRIIFQKNITCQASITHGNE